MPEPGLDLQSRVAARRAELNREAQEAARHEREKAEERQRQLEERKRAQLDALAEELTSAGTPIRRQADNLMIAEASPLEHLEPIDFKEDQLQQLLRREARRRWSPGQNWWFIAPATAGAILLIPVFPLGLLLLVLSLAYWYRTSDFYQAQLRAEFPELFGEATLRSRETGSANSTGLAAGFIRSELDSIKSLVAPSTSKSS